MCRKRCPKPEWPCWWPWGVGAWDVLGVADPLWIELAGDSLDMGVGCVDARER